MNIKPLKSFSPKFKIYYETSNESKVRRDVGIVLRLIEQLVFSHFVFYIDVPFICK